MCYPGNLSLTAFLCEKTEVYKIYFFQSTYFTYGKIEVQINSYAIWLCSFILLYIKMIFQKLHHEELSLQAQIKNMFL